MQQNSEQTPAGGMQVKPTELASVEKSLFQSKNFVFPLKSFKKRFREKGFKATVNEIMKVYDPHKYSSKIYKDINPPTHGMVYSSNQDTIDQLCESALKNVESKSHAVQHVVERTAPIFKKPQQTGMYLRLTSGKDYQLYYQLRLIPYELRIKAMRKLQNDQETKVKSPEDWQKFSQKLKVFQKVIVKELQMVNFESVNCIQAVRQVKNGHQPEATSSFQVVLKTSTGTNIISKAVHRMTFTRRETYTICCDHRAVVRSFNDSQFVARSVGEKSVMFLVPPLSLQNAEPAQPRVSEEGAPGATEELATQEKAIPLTEIQQDLQAETVRSAFQPYRAPAASLAHSKENVPSAFQPYDRTTARIAGSNQNPSRGVLAYQPTTFAMARSEETQLRTPAYTVHMVVPPPANF